MEFSARSNKSRYTIMLYFGVRCGNVPVKNNANRFLFHKANCLGDLISTLSSLQPELLILRCMNLATVWHPSVDTYLLMLIPSITPPLISTPIIAAPRPPSLHLEDPGGGIRTFLVVLACLQLHKTRPSGNFRLLMR